MQLASTTSPHVHQSCVRVPSCKRGCLCCCLALSCRRLETRPQEIVWAQVEKEAETGKTFVSPHADKEGRPVVMMRPRCGSKPVMHSCSMIAQTQVRQQSCSIIVAVQHTSMLHLATTAGAVCSSSVLQRACSRPGSAMLHVQGQEMGVVLIAQRLLLPALQEPEHARREGAGHVPHLLPGARLAAG